MEGIPIRKINLLILPLLFTLHPLPLTASMAEAQAAWAERAAAGKTEEAIRLWKDALAKDPACPPETWILLSKAIGRAVRHSEGVQAKKWADAALATSKTAIEKNPQNSDAWAEYGEAIGQWANLHKGFGSLKRVKEAVKALNTSLEYDPSNAYAHMLLAEFYRQAPSTISIGDKKLALLHAHIAVEKGPTYAINHLVYAKTLKDVGRKEEAIDQLNQVLKLSPPVDAIPETHNDQATARQLLREWGGHAS